MGSNNYPKPKPGGYRIKSGSSAGSDKEMNGKLKKTKLRRPSKMNEYGLKRIPDYTELAYKEAVSKLRYFLSGNYAPSVRSYGGSPSIKNLDESDGDLDKKYSSSYNTLSEYRPRPRLTAKYTTLYADSLNNYTPNVTSVPPAPTPSIPTTAEVAGGTNPDVVNFIQKQEEYIEQLERESQYCRDELNNLLGKVKEVISENEHLHEAQKNKLISRMFHSYNAGSESDELDDLGDSTGLDSDNKVSPSKTRKSQKSRSTRLEGPNIVFESRISELEAQLTQANIDLKKVQNSSSAELASITPIPAINKVTEALLKFCNGLIGTIQKNENNENKRKLASGLVDSTCLDSFKRQIDNLQRDKSSLESQISKLKLSLEQRDEDGKYRRGSDAVEQQLRDERNNLEAELRRIKDDLAKERSKVRELAGEGARRVIQERSAAEQRYNEHFDELQHDLAAQYDNVSKLQLDLERQRREEHDLKRELSMKNSAIEELKMELKNKISSLQADLAQAHAEKASLEEELASARLAIERQQRQAKHETNRLNSEIQSLRQRLDRADADVVHSRRENLRLTEQISTLEKELNMKNLTPISPEKNRKEKELTTMLESVENKHAKTVAELESMIQSQNSLMEKLTGECRLLTDKLDDANRRHKEELATLQRQVDVLGRSLQTPHPPSTYQAPPTHTSATNRNVPHSSTDTRRDHPGVEPTKHTERQVTSDRDSNHEGPDEHHNYSEQPGIVEYSSASIHDEHENQEIEQVPRTEVHNVTDKVANEEEINERPMDVETFDHENYNYEQNYDNNQSQEGNVLQIEQTEYQNEVQPEYANDGYTEYQSEVQPEYAKDGHTEYQSEVQPEYAKDGNTEYQSEVQPEYAKDGNTEYQSEVQPTYQTEHDQQYEQTTYAEGEYANYEQNPQQYNDPNVQYDYTTDDNYQNDQNYEQAQYTDNTQYQQEYHQDQVNPSVQVDENDSKAHNEEQPSQS